MKEIKDGHHVNETCQTGSKGFESCGCSRNYLVLGTSVILAVIILAMIFGN